MLSAITSQKCNHDQTKSDRSGFLLLCGTCIYSSLPVQGSEDTNTDPAINFKSDTTSSMLDHHVH